jgi:hypothetical protein
LVSSGLMVWVSLAFMLWKGVCIEWQNKIIYIFSSFYIELIDMCIVMVIADVNH